MSIIIIEVIEGCRKTADEHNKSIEVRQDITDFSTVTRAIDERSWKKGK
jgi:hypothetical protein